MKSCCGHPSDSDGQTRLDLAERPVLGKKPENRRGQRWAWGVVRGIQGPFPIYRKNRRNKRDSTRPRNRTTPSISTTGTQVLNRSQRSG